MSDVVKVESTKAKSGFAKLPARAKTGDVAITRHGQIKAYVLSPDRYKALVSIAEIGKGPLQKLADEFDSLVARMQREPHRRAVQALETLPLGEILKTGSRVRPRKPTVSNARTARKKARRA